MRFASIAPYGGHVTALSLAPLDGGLEIGWPRKTNSVRLKLLASRASRVGGLRAWAGSRMQGQ